MYTRPKADESPWGDDIKSIQGAKLLAVSGDIFDPVTPHALRKIHKTMLRR